MKNPPSIIGLTGYAKCGKDTFFNKLNESYPNKFKRFAFADQLKTDLDPFVKTHFGFSLFNCTAAQKEVARDLMISYGCGQRKIDENHWVKKIDEAVKSQVHNGFIPVITDFRFENEVKYFVHKYGHMFTLVGVNRVDAKDVPPQEELIQFPKVKPWINYSVEWNTVGDDQLSSLQPYISAFYAKYFS